MARHNRLAIVSVAKQNGLSPKLALARIKNGWSVERATTQPARYRSTAATLPLAMIASVRGMSTDELARGLLKGLKGRSMKRGKKTHVEVADVVATPTPTGRGITLAYLAEQYGKDPKLVYQRIRKGWTIERALTEPSRTHAPAVTLVRIAGERGVDVKDLVENLLKNASQSKVASPKRKVS